MARILIVDDDPGILDVVSYALRNEGFEAEGVSDGEAALEAARHDSYDLLILDLMMPGMSGLEVCRRLRSESKIPIVMLTAKDAELDRVLGLEIGADDYVMVVDGEPAQLTPSEFKLCALLSQQPERVFTRRQIMEYLWESPYVGDQHACEVHVSNLRRKVEKDPSKPQRIVTVRGVGYKMVAA